MSVINKLLEIIKKNKVEICISAAIFFISVLLGIIITMVNPGIYGVENEKYIKDLNSIEIIRNNINVAFKLIVGGLVLGITTIIRLFLNGFISGVMIGIHTYNYTISVILAKTIVHGIFELIGINICGGIGIKSLIFCIKGIKGEKIDFKIQIKDSVILFIFAIVLIIIGGVIEGVLLPMF